MVSLKVGALIEALKSYPEDTPVFVGDSEYGDDFAYGVDEVWFAHHPNGSNLRVHHSEIEGYAKGVVIN